MHTIEFLTLSSCRHIDTRTKNGTIIWRYWRRFFKTDKNNKLIAAPYIRNLVYGNSFNCYNRKHKYYLVSDFPEARFVYGYEYDDYRGLSR